MIVKKIYDALTNKFSSYKITYENSSFEISVPLDPANTDYQTIQEWIKEGGTVIDNGGNN